MIIVSIVSIVGTSAVWPSDGALFPGIARGELAEKMAP
jgi:hypothetical protein